MKGTWKKRIKKYIAIFKKRKTQVPPAAPPPPPV